MVVYSVFMIILKPTSDTSLITFSSFQLLILIYNCRSNSLSLYQPFAQTKCLLFLVCTSYNLLMELIRLLCSFCSYILHLNLKVVFSCIIIFCKYYKFCVSNCCLLVFVYSLGIHLISFNSYYLPCTMYKLLF